MDKNYARSLFDPLFSLSEKYFEYSLKNICGSEKFREREKFVLVSLRKIFSRREKSFASESSAISSVFHFSWWPKVTTIANTQLDIGCDRSSTVSCSEIEVLIETNSISSENCDSTH